SGSGENGGDPVGRRSVGGRALVPVWLSRRRPEGGARSPLDSADRRRFGATGWHAGGTGARPLEHPRSAAPAQYWVSGSLPAHTGGHVACLPRPSRRALGVARHAHRPAATRIVTSAHSDS